MGLADQLSAAGYDDTTPGDCILIFCGGPIYHPTEESPSAAAALIARFAVTRSLLVGLGFSNTSLGGAIGYRATSPDSFGDYILSDWETTTRWGTMSRVGLVLEAGMELPANRLLSLGLTLRGHLVPTTDVTYGDVTLRPSWSYVTLSAGLGIHLF